MCNFESCYNKKDGTISNHEFTANIKPEIGKIRPVVIIKPHKRHRLALVVPFTTQKPTKELSFTVEIPLGFMPGNLKHKKCWALCDMLQIVNLARLQRLYRQNIQNICLDGHYYSKIIEKIQKIIK
ncbi:MAG: type II toxin-antitoxin system PemK/MazF family toxin [Spirochaetaceae bacterium]|nr:type II toxin-antitoxin system PemK/MazF family toxin [Spirochaetaceae bacterium]